MRRLRRATALLLAALLLAALLLAGAAQAAERVRIVTSSFGYLYLPVFVAGELGLFAAEGIDADIVQGSGGTNAMAMLLSGDAQFFIGSAPLAWRARANGADALSIAAETSQFGSNVVVTGDWARRHGLTAASGYAERLKAMPGARLGVQSAGGGQSQLVRYLAKAAGVNPDRDMTLVTLTTAEANLAAFAQGRIDGFVFSPPASTVAVREQGGFMLFDTSKGEIAALDGYVYQTVIARQSWVEQHDDATVRTLRAVQRALDALHDPAESARAREAVHARYHAKTEPGLYAQAWADSVGSFPRTIALNQADMDRVVAFVTEWEKEPIPPAAVAAGWTNAYAARALTGMGR